MSGAEVVGTVAAVVQLVDVSIKIGKLLRDFKGKDLPEALQEIKVCLPAWTDIVRNTKAAIDDDQLSESTQKALDPVVKECKKQVESLHNIIAKVLPQPGDSSSMRARKVLKCLQCEKDVKKAEATIQKYMKIIAEQAIAEGRSSNKPIPSPLAPAFVNRPFHRDGDFVDRTVMADVVSQIDRPNPVARIALVGLGGTGKSQIAIEYAYRRRLASPETWVFWINAGSVAKVTEGYREIAKAVRIPRWDEKETDIFKVIYDWMCNEANGRWLMILDNVDELDVLTAPSPSQPNLIDPDHQTTRNDRPRQIREYLPNSTTGSILITSRARNVAFELTGNWNHCHQVEPMTEAEALCLLKKKLTGIHKEEDMISLVNAVDCMPLAISQAAAFISQRQPVISIPQFIEGLKNDDHVTTELLEESAHESHRDVDRSNSIVATWHISFQYVRRIRPSAASLLSLMSLFERQSIPRSLLETQYGPLDRFEQQISAPRAPWWKRDGRLRMRFISRDDKKKKRQHSILNYIEDWTVLNDLALIKTTANGEYMSMHRLVQLATIRWLQKHREEEFWARRFISIMRIFPDCGRIEGGDNELVNDELLRRGLYPHARRARNYRLPANETLRWWAPLMLKTASHAELNDFLDDALQLSRAALEVFKTSLGAEHELTLRAQQLVVDVLYKLGKDEEAEALLRKTLDARTKVSGETHVATIRLTRILAKMLQTQGNGKEALTLRKKAFENEVAGKGGAIASSNRKLLAGLSFARAHIELGEHQEAEEIYRSLYETIPEKVAEWDLNTVDEAHWIAVHVMKEDKWDVAESMLRRIVLAYTTRFNKSVSCEKLQLGQVVAEQGRFEEAQQLYTEVIDTCRQDIEGGGQDEWMLEAMQCMASLLMKRKQLEEAEKLCRRVVRLKEQTNGEEDINTMSAYFLLGEILAQQQQLPAALECYKRAHLVTLRIQGGKGEDAVKFRKGYEELKKRIESGGSSDPVEEARVGPGEGRSATPPSESVNA